MSLIQNSIDAITDIKEPEIIIVSKTIKQRNYIIIKDNGLGVLSENIEKIFDTFYTTSTHSSKMGLGLSIAKSISINHGGDLFYHREKTYTCFTLSLPKEQ